MSHQEQSLSELLSQQFEGQVICRVACGELTVEVERTVLLDVCTFLKTHEACAFETLIDLCGVDYQAYGIADWDVSNATGQGFSRGVHCQPFQGEAEIQVRFAAVYHLLSVTRNQRIRLRAFTELEPPVLPSVSEIWSVANWYEREAFDLFGILFEDHPDLRRLLTDYGFIGHPFRKDFPLSGHVEMRYDEAQKRVIYEPITIEPRTLVPRVIRHKKQPVTEKDANDE